MSGDAWRPTAGVAALRLRAALLAATRCFFAERGVLEVDTPALVRHAVTDVHLHTAQVHLPGHRDVLYLHTSPEFAMKRLLAAGSGDIYQLAHVFRGEERSRLHNAEFTLIEWYRCGFSLERLIDEVAQLAQRLLGLPDLPESAAPRYELLTYRDAFRRSLGCDPLSDPESTLRRLALQHGLEARLADGCSRDELLDWLMATAVGPGLGRDGLCFVHRYPASQAALARLDPADARVALRFELYCHGVELANGFEELADPVEQRHRFESDQRERARLGLPVPALDEGLLAALNAGLPPVSGVAVGFDRALMLRLGCTDIAAALPFALERA